MSLIANKRIKNKKTHLQHNQLNVDRDNFQRALQNGLVDWKTFSRLIINDLSTNHLITENSFCNVSFDEIEEAFNSPHTNWQTLLRVSETLMRVSPHYYRINNMFSNMALFNWWIDLYDVKEKYNITQVKRSYNAVSSYFEKMNIKHEFAKIMKTLPYQDVFCGLVCEDDTDFFIQKVNFSICKLYGVRDGLYNFAINLNSIYPHELNAYPDYVRQAHDDFKNGIERLDIRQGWYEPSADKQICIKLNHQYYYPFPLMITLVRDLLDLDIFKKLKKQSARTDNYKAIMMKVPIDTDHVDKPLLTPDTLSIFAEMNRESLPDDIGIVYTLGTSGEQVNFKDSNNTRNNVADCTDDIFNSSGVTKELFNGSSSGTAVTFSVENNSGFIYSLYRQFERWCNRLIKEKKMNRNDCKFSFTILDSTIFNRDTVSKRYKEACSLGVTVVDKWLASLGMTPSKVIGSYILHNDIFNFAENFKPLQSSYNASAEAGRPTNEESGKQLSDSGEATKDGDGNIDR